MSNQHAIKMNETLGVEIFDTSITHRLEINKFTKKQIKELCIDDLVNEHRQGTHRLRKLILDILTEIKL